MELMKARWLVGHSFLSHKSINSLTRATLSALEPAPVDHD
jgi:hypothetical protein